MKLTWRQCSCGGSCCGRDCRGSRCGTPRIDLPRIRGVFWRYCWHHWRGRVGGEIPILSGGPSVRIVRPRPRRNRCLRSNWRLGVHRGRVHWGIVAVPPRGTGRLTTTLRNRRRGSPVRRTWDQVAPYSMIVFLGFNCIQEIFT